MNLNLTKRILCLLLSLALLMGNIPAVAFAAEEDGLCDHHSVHADCGYEEGVSDCGYDCAECAAAAATEGSEETEAPAQSEVPEETAAPTETATEPSTEETEQPTETAEPSESEQTEPDCTGLADCPAESHHEGCEKKLADEKAASDKSAADAVLSQIGALPALEDIQAKPMAEQHKDYEQVQAVYAAYSALSSDQQALLPSAEDVFKPYFDYFNSLVSLIWSGSGTSSSPFLIYTESELRSLAQQVKSGKTYSGTYFRLASDITLTSDWTPIGTEAYKFRGTFDGNDCTISGMTVTGSYSGLFAYVGSGATIKNVNLTDISVTGADHVAGLIAYADAGTDAITIANCSVHGSLVDNDEAYPGGYLAGIVAYANAESGAITISDCTSTGSYTCDYDSGGIVGYGKGSSRSLKIRNCTNRAGIGGGSNSDSCGGIAGYLYSAELENCMNYGNVAGNAYSEDNGSSWLGGISGGGTGSAFTGCGNYGDISTFFAGGITPAQYGNNVIESCLNVGELTHSSDGYGAALIYSGSAMNSYYLSGTGTGFTGATSATASEMASGEVAHALREYFGQEIGVDTYPVPLTADNRVYKVTVVGETSGNYYVNYGGIVALPELSSCAAYFDGESKFDPSTPITRDYALVAMGYHDYEDGICTYCGNEGVAYIDAGSCGESAAWTLTEDGVLTISGSGAMADYSAADPAPWSGYASDIQSVVIDEGVTNVGAYAFNGLTNVTAVSMAKTVTNIGKYAFNGLTNLTAVTIGDAVTSIGEYAFGSCTALNELTLGKRLETIGAYAFYRCEGLRSVSLPGSVTTLGDGAFRGCTALQYLWLPSTLTTIGTYALAETGLTYMDIPAAVSKIGDYAFANCSDLWQVTFLGAAPTIAGTAFSGDTVNCYVPEYDSSWAVNVQKQFGGTLTWAMGGGSITDTMDWILDFDGTLIISGTGTMYNFSSGNAPWYSLREKILSAVVSDGVTSIGNYAFGGCSNLRSVTIAESVTKIGSSGSTSGYCFRDCTSLTQITIPKNVTAIAYASFFGCYNLTTITVASGNTAYSSADGVLYDRYKDTLHSYPGGKSGAFTIPSSVDEIAPYAFANCESLTEVTIPAYVTYIGNEAFGYCDALSHITFTGSAPTTINSYAFFRVTADVDYPTSDTTWTADKLKNYGGSLTWNAGSGSCGTNVQWDLTYTNGLATLTVSGTGAMDDYTLDTLPWKDHVATIKTFVVNDGVTSVGAYALCPGTNSAVDTSLTTVTLADSVTSIGSDAFCFCTSLKTLTLGNGIKTIGDSAFTCTALTALDFPDSLQTIGRYAFQSCDSLKTLAFGNGLQTIGYTAFGGCTALQTVDLGSSVTTLEQSAFNGCSKLTKIVIPASVTSVGTYAFRNCTNLQYVEFLGNAPTFNSNAFGGTTCNAYYLSSKSGWTSSKLANYGGTLTWGAISQRGSCGTNAEWILDTAGNLYICGSGAMKAYSATSNAPWYPYRASIKKVGFRGVTSVGAYAFSGCTAISEVSVPSTISSVGTYAFADCSDLQVVIFEGSAPSFGTNAFSNVTCEMWYPSAKYWSTSVRKDYGGTLTWRSTTSSGTCGTNARWALDSTGTLVVLGSGAMNTYSSGYQPWYSSKASITSVIIGGKITSVTNYAFSNFTAIQSVTIGESVTSVGSYAFRGCSALTSITFRGNAPTINSYAFYNVTATAYYPLANSTSWTSSKRTNYGGTLTWEAVCMVHQETVAAAVAPTCTTTGLTEGSYCSLCDEVLVAQEVVPANGHYVIGLDGTQVPADTLEADCTTAYVCTVCKAVAKEALGHRVLGTVPVETDPLTITNDSTYPFKLTDGTYYSTNKSHDSSSYLLITAQYACTLTLNYGVSSEEDYDKLRIYLNNSLKNTISGEVDNQTLTLTLAAGDVVKVRYSKDEDTHEGSNKGWVTLVYDPVMVDGVGDVPADTAEPDCTNGVVCEYCQTVVKEALGHRVIVQLPEPEQPFEVVNTSAYPFTLTAGVYYSGNKGINSSTSSLQFNVISDCTLTLNYGVSSEGTYDKLIIKRNSTALDTISGTTSGKTLALDLTAGDVITVSYSKDVNVNKNDDQGWVSVEYDCGPTEKIVPADTIEADCDGVTCDYCQTVVKEPLGHDWDEGVENVPATEETEGEMLHTCERCGATKTESIPVLEHTHRYEAVVTPPACEADGYTTHSCRCGDTYTDTPVAALGHDMGDWSVTTAPSCTETGLQRKDCSRCDHFETVEIEATGHSYEAVVTPPTCTTDGYTTHTCTVCGDSYTDTPVTKLDHDMGDWSVTTAPSCTETGLQRKDCSRCDHFETVEIEATGHSHEAVVTPPTCTTDGYTTHTCTVCGDTYTDTPVAALGHDMGQWVVTADPTCTETGLQRKDCSRCDHFEEDMIPAGHTYDSNYQCTVCGVYEQLASGTCGEDLNWVLDKSGAITISGTGTMEDSDSAAAPWYEDREWIQSVVIENGVTSIGDSAFDGCSNLTSVEIPESVTSIGASAFRDCTDLKHITIPDGVTGIGSSAFDSCGSLTSIVIPGSVTSIGDDAFAGCDNLTDVYYGGTAEQWAQLGENVPDAKYIHNSCTNPENHWQTGSVEATCTDDGYTHELCACGHERNKVITDAAFGHDMGSWAVTDAPACTETGMRRKDCSRCDHFEEEVIPATGHSHEAVVTPPTCTEDGYTTHTCAVCGDTYTDAPVNKLGHDMSQWVITTPAACTETGLQRKDCGHCDHFEEEVIPATGHSHEAVVTPPTCTEDGYTTHTCHCGDAYTDSYVDKLGHTEVIDEAVAPTCTETGLTEGMHCSVCEEVLLAQEEVPANTHSFEQKDAQIICAVCAEELTVRITQDYAMLDLQAFQSAQLAVYVSPAEFTEAVQWSIEGDENVLSVDQYGVVTAMGVGTAHVVATVTEDGFAVSARCRIDVAETLPLDGIQLSTTALTTELYSTNFTGFEILLQLPQNYPAAATTYGLRNRNTGIMMESARFTDENMAKLFELIVLDDRSILLIPTDYAVEHPEEVLSKYSNTTITVTVQDKEYESEKLTLKVKKTKPKLKATIPAFNSFYSGQSQQIVITGGTVTSIYENEAKNTAKATAIPYWLTLNEDGTLSLNETVPLKSISGNAYIKVETEQWRIPAAVTLRVKNAYKARGLKLSASTVSMTAMAEQSDGVSLKLLCTKKKETLSDLKVTGITAPEGYSIENWNPDDGSFTLKTLEGFEAGAIVLNVSFEDTTVTMPLKLTVKTAKAALKLSASKVTLNKKASDSAEIQVTATPADYRIEDLDIRLTGTETINGKKTTVDKKDAGELAISYGGGILSIQTTDKTPEKASYKLYISAGGSKELTVTVNVISAEPSVTLKAAGSMDLSFPDQTAAITAAFKNYSGRIVSYDYSIAEQKDKTGETADVTDKFELRQSGKTFTIRCIDDTDINIKNTYAATLKLMLEDGRSLEQSINLKIKRTSVKLKLSSSKLTLNKKIGDTGSITVTYLTEGYDYTGFTWTLTDSRNNQADGELSISCTEDKLVVATNDATVYGKSYKITLKGDDYGKASVLTVSIPTEAKSNITAALKVSGKLDVIRDGSTVTVTPAYKNCITTTTAEEELAIYNSKGECVTELFDITSNGRGGYAITKAEALTEDEAGKLTAGTYKIRFTAMFGEMKVAPKDVKMSVVMGKAKLKVQSSAATMFAKDKNDRTLVWFETTDTTLNDVTRIEIKDAKYKNAFEIIEYGDGLFAIGFKDGQIHPTIAKLLAKKASTAITLKLNVYLDGNQTAKANTTAKLKLTIVK